MRSAIRITMLFVLAAFAGCGDTVAQVAPAPAELAVNGGFEAAGAGGLPSGWVRDMAATGEKGTAARDTARARGGGASLKLVPNARNGGNTPLAVSQVISATQYRGRTVTFSGYLSSTPGTTGYIGLLSIANGRPGNLAMLSNQGGENDWIFRSAQYKVPNGSEVSLVLFASTDGTGGEAWFDDVAVTFGAPDAPRQAAPVERAAGPMEVAITVDAGRAIRPIPATLFGAMVEWRWNGNFIWDEAADRLDPRLVELTRDLGVTLLRYPGGVYSDYYFWKQGVGPRSRRPVVTHEIGSQDESRPNFGTDEVLDLARRIGGEVMITVNAGSGTAEEAAQWVRYVKDKQPAVRIWEVGNELYLNDSVFAKAISVDPRTYARRFVQFARAMRRENGDIRIAAIGGSNYGRYNIVMYKDWNRTLLTEAGDEIDLLAVHNSYAPVVLDDSADFDTVYRALFAAPTLMRENFRTLADEIRRYAPSRASHIRLAVTEWGPFFQVDWGNRYVDHNKTLGSALYVASLFKVFLETPELEVATFCHLNDLAGFGWIGTRNDAFPPQPDWAPTARYHALAMFSRHFGRTLVDSTCQGPTFDSEALGYVAAVKGVPYVESVASLSADGNTLYLMVINKDAARPARASLSIDGFQPAGEAVVWTLTGASMDANTGTKVIKIPGQPLARQAQSEPGRFYRGGPGEITMERTALSDAAPRCRYEFAPRSITSIAFTRKAE